MRRKVYVVGYSNIEINERASLSSGQRPADELPFYLKGSGSRWGFPARNLTSIQFTNFIGDRQLGTSDFGLPQHRYHITWPNQ